MSHKPISEFTNSSQTDAGPEHSSKHQLTKWLKKNGAGVLWEEENEWEHPTFEIRREFRGGVPDLIILIDGKTFVVEYKTGDSVGQVYDSLPQLIRYWQEHIESGQEYYAGETKLKVDGFLTASSHSRFGRLFPRYAERRQDYCDMDETRQSCREWNQLPPAEYRMTEQHIRTMWRMVKQIGGGKATDHDTPHVGSLLSDVLVSPSDDPNPAILWNKGTANQQWEVLA